MTFEKACNSGKPFLNHVMRNTIQNPPFENRFLMQIDDIIMYFDSDGKCGNWLKQYGITKVDIKNIENNYIQQRWGIL